MGSKAIDADQWSKLDEFWQLRRAEILADLQTQMQYGPNPPPDEAVQESQTSFGAEKLNLSHLLHTMSQAGHGNAPDDISHLLHDRPAEFAWLGFKARQGIVVFNDYEKILAMGGAPQTESANARIAAAREALAQGEVGVKAFLSKAVSD